VHETVQELSHEFFRNLNFFSALPVSEHAEGIVKYKKKTGFLR